MAVHAPTVASHVNRLPWDAWIPADQMPGLIDLPPAEAEKVLRAARRKGSVTVRRMGSGLQYKRVRRHPLPSQRHVVFS